MKIKFAFLRGGGHWGREENRPKLFFRGKWHDNKNLKEQISLSRNSVVIAQAPKGCQGVRLRKRAQSCCCSVRCFATPTTTEGRQHVPKSLKNQKNRRSHKNQSALPPQIEEFYGHGVFLQKERRNSRRP